MTLPDPAFWSGKRVLLTGHTGFKGSWCALWLKKLGADVTGFALAPEPGPSLYNLAGVGGVTRSIIGDLRDAAKVSEAVIAAKPDVVIHMAAQALVRRSIADPVATFATNVQGTVNLLDALRKYLSAQTILVVTSDKVYAKLSDKTAQARPHIESDPLGGTDAYSASKAACEIVTRAYALSYFEPAGIPLGTARGGNVIGGGDFAEDRLVPDVIRAVQAGAPITLRHPEATRPWQHVLDCVGGYLVYAEALAKRQAVSPALNFGPDRPGVTVARLAETILTALGKPTGWQHKPQAGSIERDTLEIDASRARKELGWRPRLTNDEVVRWTADWYRAFASNTNLRDITGAQIAAYGKASA